jgi:xyloglucan:xyloglucosyl transferase
LPIISFDEGYTQLFGDDNLVMYRDGKRVHLSLDERTGSRIFIISVLGL